jgi:hypothetical protein
MKDSAGTVHAIASGSSSDGTRHSVLLNNFGGAWHAVYGFQMAPGMDTYGFGFAAAPDGTLYTAGYGVDYSAGTITAWVRSLSAARPATSPFSATPIIDARQSWKRPAEDVLAN